MTEDEQDWLAELGFSEEDEVWPPRRGPTIKELKNVFDKYTLTGMDGDTLQPGALQDLWQSGAMSMWCDELEVILQGKSNFDDLIWRLCDMQAVIDRFACFRRHCVAISSCL